MPSSLGFISLSLPQPNPLQTRGKAITGVITLVSGMGFSPEL